MIGSEGNQNEKKQNDCSIIHDYYCDHLSRMPKHTNTNSDRDISSSKPTGSPAKPGGEGFGGSNQVTQGDAATNLTTDATLSSHWQME